MGIVTPSKTYKTESHKTTEKKRQIAHIEGDFLSILSFIDRTLNNY